jgi:hypothetical protein
MGSGVGGSDPMVVTAAHARMSADAGPRRRRHINALDVPFTAMGTMTTPVAMVT